MREKESPVPQKKNQRMKQKEEKKRRGDGVSRQSSKEGEEGERGWGCLAV